jgi:hypothetical protein
VRRFCALTVCTSGTPILKSGTSLFSTKYHVGTRYCRYLRTYILLVPYDQPFFKRSFRLLNENLSENRALCTLWYSSSNACERVDELWMFQVRVPSSEHS